MAASGRRFFSETCLHRALLVSIAITLVTGILHLFNLVDIGRSGFGPALITFFRASFVISLTLLAAGFAAGRRWPRLDRFDIAILAVSLVFMIRGAFTPETFASTINLVVTGAGVFFLVRFGTRTASDIRILLIALVGAALAISIYGLFEYAFASNPLFDSIQIDAIGIDTRVDASQQIYRVRSLVGHPGFVGAILLGSAPLALLLLWRRRWWAEVALLLMAACLFFTFSRGSWIIGGLVLLPIFAYAERQHIRRNIKWLLLLILLPIAIIAFDYFDREEVSAGFGEAPFEQGLSRTAASDGPVMDIRGDASGIQPTNQYIYFDIADNFYYGGEGGPVTVIVNYNDRGLGAIRLEYDSSDPGASEQEGAYVPTASINKLDTHEWTSCAFYLNNPRFEGRQNAKSDFRVVDTDSQMILGKVTVQKGRLKLPSLVTQQWMSRPNSVGNRAGFVTLTWDVLRDNPLGVGLFNSPGTDHHAIDSLPLTWMIEFGWPGLILLAVLLGAVVRECWLAWREPGTPAAVLLLSLLVMLMHGGHLMILYDKPSLVLMAAVTALYVNIRPWRHGGAAIAVVNEDCMI